MQSASFRFISATVSALLLVALAAVIGLAIRDNSHLALSANAPTVASSQFSPINGITALPEQQNADPQPPSLTATTPDIFTETLSLPNSVISVDPDAAVAGGEADGASASDASTPMALPTPPRIALASVQRVALGGFSFQAPADYGIDVTGSAVNLQAADADPTIGPIFLLSGGPPGQFVSGSTNSLDAIFTQFVDFFAARDNFNVENQRAHATANLRGLSADIANADDATGRPFVGQIFMAQPGANQIFVMVGIAPTDKWASSIAADYEAVLDSVHTFVPGTEEATVVADAATETATSDGAPSGDSATPSSTATSSDNIVPDAAATDTPVPTVSAPDAAATDTPAPTPSAPDAAASNSASAISTRFAAAAGAISRRNATSTPIFTAIPTPTPVSESTSQWQVLSNGNYIHAVAVENRTAWAASDGGIVAWNLQSGAASKFTTADGLEGNAALAAQSCPVDSLGLVFGSEAGLQIFDLRSGGWRTLNSSNSPMSFDNIAALYCNVEAGFLVVGYANQGLDIFDANAAAWTYIELADSDLANSELAEMTSIYAIAAVDDLAEIWVGTEAGVRVVANGEVALYDSVNSPLPAAPVRAVATDAAGAVWLIVENALFQVTGTADQRQWARFDAASVSDPTFPDGPLTGMAVAGDGTIWVASADVQICQFDPTAERCIRNAVYDQRQQNGLAAGPLTSMTVRSDESGEELYYTTAGNGFSRFAEDRWQLFVLADELLQGNQIRDLVQEQNGTIWVASDGGVQQIDPTRLNAGSNGAPAAEPSLLQRFEQINSNLFSRDIQVLQPDGAGGIWFGAEGAGYYDGTTWSNYSAVNGLVGGKIQAMSVDNARRVWFGAEEGLSIFNGDAFFSLTEAEGLPSRQITALLTDRIATDNIVWIGTADGGLLRFDKNQIQVYNQDNADLPSNTITALSQDADGTLLVGTDSGMVRFSEERSTPIRPIGTTKITTIAAGPNGTIWAGTVDSGLYYFNGLAWEQFTNRDYLPAQHVTSILVDQDGTVWIGCANGGLVRYVDE